MKFDLHESDIKKWPHNVGVTCISCGSSIRTGQVCIAGKGARNGTIAFHYECFQRLAKFEPAEEVIDGCHEIQINADYARIQRKIKETNGDPFGFKERNGF